MMICIGVKRNVTTALSTDLKTSLLHCNKDWFDMIETKVIPYSVIYLQDNNQSELRRYD